MSLRFVLLVAAAGAACACSRPLGSAVTLAPDTAAAARSSPRPAGVTQRDEDDLREAAFRYMFRKNASALQQRAQVFCLRFENRTDPPAAFIARFASNKIPVVSGSRCEDKGDGIVARATGAHGLAFRIDSLAWTDRDHATVGGGYFESGLSASGNVYTLERKLGAWVVTKDVTQWIS